MGSSITVTHYRVWEQKMKLHNIFTHANQSMNRMCDAFHADQKEMRDQTAAWMTESHALISDLKAKGQLQLADFAAKILLGHEFVRQPLNFKFRISTGIGTVAFEITGSEEGSAMELDDELSEQATIETQSVNHAEFFELADPVTTSLDDAEVLALPTLTLEGAIHQKLWICRAKEGFAFCLACPCAPMVVPEDNGEGTTHRTVARYFHRNPFQWNNAQAHFAMVHLSVFPQGVRDLVKLHGRAVRYHHNAPNNIILNKWMIAGLNTAVQKWYDDLAEVWDTMRCSIRSDQTRETRNAIIKALTSKRTIAASCIPNTFVTSWPSAQDKKWAFICSHPECDLPDVPENPFLDNRAKLHLLTHDIKLHDNNEIMNLFGYEGTHEVIGNYSTSSGEAEQQGVADPEPPKRVPKMRVIELEQNRRSSSSTPLGKTDISKARRDSAMRITKNKNRQRFYEAWSQDRLRQECGKRGIDLPATTTSIRSMASQLCFDDFEKEDGGRAAELWASNSINELRAQCKARGLTCKRSSSKVQMLQDLFSVMLSSEDDDQPLGQGHLEEDGTGSVADTCGTDTPE
ncbi:hypothetical protein F4678DRAFT_225628 [Xylaria arbuscula]|nr:hypothetical protein F4678DRAFT_225628 [Xylaria arbuscula]